MAVDFSRVNRNQQRHGSHKPIQEFETTSSMGYNGVDYFAPEMTIALPPISSAGGWRTSTGCSRILASLL